MYNKYFRMGWSCICHIFWSEERKKKNIRFVTWYMSHGMVRDPQMPDLQVQCCGLDVHTLPPSLFRQKVFEFLLFLEDFLCEESKGR